MSQPNFTDSSGRTWTLPELVRATLFDFDDQHSFEELRALHAELTLALDEADEELDRQEAEIDNPPKYDPQDSAEALSDGWN